MAPQRDFVALDSGDAKFMALLERFSERLEWMRGDAEQRTRQLELQASTLGALEKGMSKMEGMLGAMREELRATAALSERMVDGEKRLSRLEDNSADLELAVRALVDFKQNILNKLALIGLVSFLGGGGVSVLAIKVLFGGHV